MPKIDHRRINDSMEVGDRAVGLSLAKSIHISDGIFSHVRPNTLTTATFHGLCRSEDPAAFANVDLVLTTYSTLMSDHRKAGVLHQLNWFRVVLDEGKL